jgi:penicillin-binding protein 1B
LRLAAVGLAGGLIVLAVTYVQVRLTFHQRLRGEPSRIYSDSLALRPGMGWTASALDAEMVSRGYRSSPDWAAVPGRFRRDGASLRVFLNSFEYPRGAVDGYRVRVRFRDRRILSLEMADDGRDLDVVMVEPRLLDTFHGPRHEIRFQEPLAAMPAVLIRAVLEVEDRRFRNHGGLDLRGMARAAWQDLRAGGLVQGGSTITQQLVKNVLLGHHRTFGRKIRELVMAPMLETMLTKDEILEIYLNEIYLGQKGARSVVGVGAAARFYFGRPAAELGLGQAALLAGLIRSPGTYNPWVHPERGRRRRDEVLDRLVAAGVVPSAEADAARRHALRLTDATGESLPEAGYYVDFVRRELMERYGPRRLERAGLRFLTTLDTRYQKAAARALKGGLDRLEADAAVARHLGNSGLQGAVVAMDPRTGALLALVGGKEFTSSMFNRAVDARRQVGSLFKPFVYLAAFEAAAQGEAGGLTPVSLLADAPLTVEAGPSDWTPTNNDGRFRGEVTVREALAASINVPAVRAAQGVGVAKVAELAVACGFPADIPQVPALALGSAAASPLEVAVAFASLAAAGRRPEPWWLKAVIPAGPGWPATESPGRLPAVAPEAAYLVIDLMQEAVRTGTARRLAREGMAGGVAGKTGTTNGRRDAWFVGATPEFLAAVWIGADDNRSIGVEGSQAALPIWIELVRSLHLDTGGAFPVPDGIVFEWVDPATGARATGRCPRVVEQPFIAGTEPSGDCPKHPRRGFWRRLFGR